MRFLKTGLICVLALGFVSACDFGTTEFKARRKVRNKGGGKAHGSISIPTQGGGGGQGSLPPAGPDAPGSDNPPVATGDYKIGGDGLLTGKNVHHYIGGGSQSYSGGKPKGIILHKTAGRSCNSNNTTGNQKPHIYVCRDGRVIVNGSFNKARTAAEAFHNNWSINIEIEASYTSPNDCDRRGEMTWGQKSARHSGGWRGKCYQEMTDAQVAATRPILAALSQKYGIPLKLPHNVRNQAEYVSQQTNILQSGRYGRHSANPSNMRPGVLPSFWTAQNQANLFGANGGNHDDGASWNEMKRLGIIQ